MGGKIKMALLVCLLLALGFLRENIFVNVNTVLSNKFFNSTEHHTASPYMFLYAFPYKALYVAKWFITPFFAFIFFYVQHRFLWFLFHEKKTFRWLSVLYLSLFLLSGIFFVTGWALGNIYSGYTFSRMFMGLLQSPVPCMILIPITYLDKYYNVDKTIP